MNHQPPTTEEDEEPAGYKDSVLVEGVTPNYIWYESEILRKNMQSWSTRFEKLVRVMGERHAENLKLTLHLYNENQMLKDLLKQLGMRPATRKEKITNPGVYWVPDTNEEKKE